MRKLGLGVARQMTLIQKQPLISSGEFTRAFKYNMEIIILILIMMVIMIMTMMIIMIVIIMMIMMVIIMIIRTIMVIMIMKKVSLKYDICQVT